MLQLTGVGANSNLFSEIPAFIGNLRELVLLDFRQNQLRKLPKELCTLKKLQKLFLNENKLYALPEQIGDLESLELLNLSKNDLMALPNTVHRLSKLTVLDVRLNQLHEAPNVNMLPNLFHLSLRSNRLTSFSVQAGHFVSLRHLDLYGNLLKKISICEGEMTNLQHLDLENNSLSSFPSALLHMPQLSILYLSKNCLKKLPRDIDKIKSLLIFSVSDNQISELPENIKNMNSLRDFDLSRNPVCSNFNHLQGFIQALQNVKNLKMEPPKDHSKPAEPFGEKKKAKEKSNKLMGLFGSPRHPTEDSHEEESEGNEEDEEYEDILEGQDPKELLSTLERASRLQELPAFVTEVGCEEEMNKAGMKRGKKENVLWQQEKGKEGRKEKKRFQMEDVSLVSFPFDSHGSCGLFCVFDGHAGDTAACLAKEKFPGEFERQLECVCGERLKHDLSAVFHNTFLEVDNQLKSSCEYVGATATCVFIWKLGNKTLMQASNVGDSSAFLYRNKKPVALTQDHSLKKDGGRERQRLEKYGIEVLEGQTRLNGLGITRALGDHFAKQMNCGLIAVPETSPVYELGESDSHVVVASDGLWDVLDAATVFEILQNNSELSAKELATKLTKTAVANNK